MGLLSDKPKRRRLDRRTDDIIPASQSQPSPTARPVVVSNKPEQTDNTLVKNPRPIMRHKVHLVPTGAAPAPLPDLPAKPAVPPEAPAAVIPPKQPVPPVPEVAAPPVPFVTPPAPPSAAGLSAGDPPAQPNGPASPSAVDPPSPAPAPAAPVPTVEAGDHLDELDLSTLTGVHGLKHEPAAELSALSPGQSGAPATPPQAVAVESQPINQTPAQAMQMAAALRDLKRNPAAPPPDRPIVVVHQHDYLRSILVFFGAMIAAGLLVAITFDLLLDAEILDLPVIPLTDFFN